MVVKAGGPDPNVNGKLKDVIAKAKANNVPNDNIERTIKKASSADAASLEEMRYEGYGPGGAAVIVIAATDNSNRTTPEIRSYFSKYKGNLGTTGCVGYLFEDKGVIIIDAETADEDQLMEDALEAGADDVIPDEGVFDIRTAINAVADVSEALTKLGYTVVSAQPEYVPSTYTALQGDDITRMGKMLEMFEDNDDLQAVWHNWENADDAE